MKQQKEGSGGGVIAKEHGQSPVGGFIRLDDRRPCRVPRGTSSCRVAYPSIAGRVPAHHTAKWTQPHAKTAFRPAQES